MLNQIDCDKKLKKYLHKVIADNGIKVSIDSSLNSSLYRGIKVDDYYNGLHIATPPKTVDFVVVVDCSCNAYVLYVLELKNVKTPEHLVIKDIQDKFKNTLDDFLTIRYGSIFLNDSYKYKNVKLYLVSDAYNICGKFDNHESYRKYADKINKKDSLKVDHSLSEKLFKFKKKILKIEYDIPPNPIIKKII